MAIVDARCVDQCKGQCIEVQCDRALLLPPNDRSGKRSLQLVDQYRRSDVSPPCTQQELRQPVCRHMPTGVPKGNVVQHGQQ